MLSKLDGVIASLREVLDELDPATLHTSDAVALLKRFVKVQNLGASGKMLLAQRAGESDEWADGGFRNPAEGLAKIAGISTGEALRILETARQLDDLDDTKAAVTEGELSETQVNEVAKGAKADPAAERKLLNTAKRRSVNQLRRERRRVQAAAEDEDEARRRARAERRMRVLERGPHATRVELYGPTEEWAQFEAALKPFETEIFERARTNGRREPREAYLWDALLAMARAKLGGATGKTPATLILISDLDAYTRGRTKAGETCEIDGVGPVSVAAARKLADDAKTYAVVKNDAGDVVRVVSLGRCRASDLTNDAVHGALAREGLDPRTIVGSGRTIPTLLEIALLARDRECTVPDCHVSHNLDFDHSLIDFAKGGPTTYWNLDRKCRYHHRLKTLKGYRVDGPPGHRRWIHPDGRTLARDCDTGCIDCEPLRGPPVRPRTMRAR